MHGLPVPVPLQQLVAARAQFSNGKKADPRSFCIRDLLQDVAHDGALEKNLMFAGHNAYRFGQDPFYSNGFVPSVKQLVSRTDHDRA